MIKFITNRIDHEIVASSTIKECMLFLDTLDIIGIDTENSSLVPHHCTPLLLQLGNEEQTFVIDTTSVDISWLNIYSDKTFIGANLKYDYSVLKAQFGIELRNLIDVMIVEQTTGMGSGRRNSLDIIIERRLNTKATFEKSTRNEFIGANKNFVLQERHIIYAADDIKYLHPIWEVQQPIVEKLGMTMLLKDIEFPLISILADCELEGLKLDVDKWKSNILKNRQELYKTQVLLDVEVKKLADEESPFDKETLSLKGGKFTRKRNTPVDFIQTGLFGEDKPIKLNNIGNINYGSDTQVKDIFTRAGEYIPRTKEGKETIGVENLKVYLIDYPETRLYKFIELLIKFSEVSQKINSFGQGHIDIISPKTNKIHTIYRQCTAKTGRFQSGDKRSKLPFFNSQQIPKSNDYRHCFYTDEGYSILTIDLSSAELIILASLANDRKLLELQAGDPHSYLANASYNNLLKEIRKSILSRGGEILENHILEVQELLEGNKPEEKIGYTKAKEILENFMEGQSLVISKTNLGWIRDKFKNVVYGLIYGATATRISEVMGISKNWAQIVLNTMKYELPATFTYLDKVASLAVNRGYTLLSPRTKSRRWFSEVLESKANKTSLSYNKAGDIEREAKNAGIQGTNAFIIKEAIVRIENEYIKLNKIDAKLLLQVHDELVYKFKSEIEEFPKKVYELLTDTAKRYLAEGVSMGASYIVKNTWHK